MTDSTESKKDYEETYLVTYTRHLERKVRSLETEKQLLDAERVRLEREVHSTKVELDRMRQPPLIAATVVDVLSDGRAAVKSSAGPQFIVHVTGSVSKDKLAAGVRVALNQRTFSLVEILPPTRDPLVKGMEVEEAPEVAYGDIGGLKDQIRDVREAVELPLLHPELFEKIGIEAPKGVLLCGLPGTGKTLVARAVAHETKTAFIRIIGSELVQKFIGEGARLVREVFNMAREKSPAIVFIDELDAIGSRRLDIATSGDREVQRTLMQLLSVLDGFDSRGDVRIIAATNRPDILDPALLRPGRFDRIIEFPVPSREARKEIFGIHTKKMSLSNIDFDKLINTTDGSTGADIKAICTEAGMFAIRQLKSEVSQDDFEKAVEKILGGPDDQREHHEIYG